VTNFSNALPPPQSDLAKEIVRDPYNFDFLKLREPIAERELEEGLLVHHRKTRGAIAVQGGPASAHARQRRDVPLAVPSLGAVSPR
jgi:hypothetical protein